MALALANEHWQQVWEAHRSEDVSWFQAEPQRSLLLLRMLVPRRSAGIIDVGGGASRLVDLLQGDGYRDLTVLDLAPAALERAADRLGERGRGVTWIAGDVLEQRFERRYDAWHDRALFHFLVDPGERQRYVDQAARAVAPGGHLVVATFGVDGPETCSGLPVVRHSPATLEAAICGSADCFEPVGFEDELHMTPGGTAQRFQYGWFRKVSPAGA